MSTDYKPRQPRSKRAGSFLAGILIGLLLGLFIAGAVAWYITSSPSPFRKHEPMQPIEPIPPVTSEAPKSAAPVEEKRRFDFYNVLPGTEELVPEQELKQPVKIGEMYYVQAGSFQKAADADNQKAKLALLGFEASVSSASIPDKGVWHRVRLGPYSKVDEVKRVRAGLKQNAVESSLIKVREAAPR
ncbi:MAG: SPOR domain-containing protein [Burkholderiales bacterium]